jgi:hypothetical protein
MEIREHQSERQVSYIAAPVGVKVDQLRVHTGYLTRRYDWYRRLSADGAHHFLVSHSIRGMMAPNRY